MAKRARFLWLSGGTVNHCRNASRNKITGQNGQISLTRPAVSWNPEIYLAFADHRTRSAAELLARVRAEHPARVIDLGCGPGNSTALLAARWPQAELEGLDSSAAMLAEARASGVPARWVEADLASWIARALA